MDPSGPGVNAQMANHCSAAGVLAGRLGLRSDVRASIEQSYARWDGKGVPSGLARDGVTLSARISHVAEACEVFHRTGGIERALEMVRARRVTHFYPAFVDAVEPDAAALFAGLDDDTVDEILDAEPVERPPLTDGELDLALEAIGDFCDLRCPYFAGHSRGTADLVARAATHLGLADGEATLARRAALVHDVGRIGVPGTVWDKPGALTGTDRERMRMHVYYVERIFGRPEPLRRIGLLAATHHERMDGSGYHRGIGGAMLSTPARLLGAADAYHAMTQPRPHRPAMSDAEAARTLRSEVDAGRLDAVAVDAVLAAAGHATTGARAGGPGGLTAREGDVLALLVQGLPNKGIAKQLGISPKTVGNHIERIYTKLGVTNRAAAAMRAMQQGLVAAEASTH
jgi:HD-GYP domain-containing protein (c-di-GMP phosphodiesterase class II)